MMTLYRLRFRDGSYGAWGSNLDSIKKDAEFFGATIESRVFNFLVR